jgi:hypothetical protein
LPTLVNSRIRQVPLSKNNGRMASKRSTWAHNLERSKFLFNCELDHNDHAIMLARPFVLARLHASFIREA